MTLRVVDTPAVKPAKPATPPARNPGFPLDLDWVGRVRMNRSALERRAATIGTRRTVKKDWQAGWLLRAITLMDLTTLNSDDTPGRVERLCAKARHPLTQDILDGLEMIEKKVVAMAESLPEEKYSWRPGAGVRSFGEVLRHVVGRHRADLETEDFGQQRRGRGETQLTRFFQGTAGFSPRARLVHMPLNCDLPIERVIMAGRGLLAIPPLPFPLQGRLRDPFALQQLLHQCPPHRCDDPLDRLFALVEAPLLCLFPLGVGDRDRQGSGVRISCDRYSHIGPLCWSVELATDWC